MGCRAVVDRYGTCSSSAWHARHRACAPAGPGGPQGAVQPAAIAFATTSRSGARGVCPRRSRRRREVPSHWETRRTARASASLPSTGRRRAGSGTSDESRAPAGVRPGCPGARCLLATMAPGYPGRPGGAAGSLIDSSAAPWPVLEVNAALNGVADRVDVSRRRPSSPQGSRGGRALWRRDRRPAAFISAARTWRPGSRRTSG